MAQHCVAETKCAGQLVQGIAVALDVHQHIVRLVDLGDGKGQLAPPPIFEPMHATIAGRDHSLVALQHGWNLFTLVRMNQEYDLVMPLWHEMLPVEMPPENIGEARRK